MKKFCFIIFIMFCIMFNNGCVEQHNHTYTKQIVDATCTSAGYTKYTCTDCGDVYYDNQIESSGHILYDDIIKNATCKESGIKNVLCKKCDYNESVVIPILDHSYSESIVNATCEVDGTKTFTCDMCGHTKVEVISATGHIISIKEGYASTCEIDGLTNGSFCLKCNKVLSEQIVIPATGHSYVVSIIAPSCENDGYTQHKCNTCGDMYVDCQVDKLGHIVEVKKGYDSTCVKDGLTDGSYCSRCNQVFSEQVIIPAKEHLYNAVIIKPTCTSQGYTTHTCSRCNDTYNDSYEEIIPHDYTSEVTLEAKCETDGVKTYICKGCSHSYDEVINKLGHNYKDVVVDATCTSQGYTTHTCSNCNDTYDDSYEEIIPHDYISEVTLEAKCETDGVKTYTCKGCSHSYDEVINKLGHNYKDVVVDATCTSQGYTTHTCSRCNDTYDDSYEEIIPHDYTSEVTLEAKCETDGVKTYTCKGCSHSYDEVINKLGHNYTSSVINEAKCELSGLKIYTCSNCNDNYKEIIDKLGHNYLTTEVAPTCTEDGYTQHSCSRCTSSYKSDIVDALGHQNIVVDKGYPATCEDSGLTDGTHCETCKRVITEREIINALGHKEVIDEMIKPTCISEGKTQGTHCERCELVFTEQEIIPVIEHEYLLETAKCVMCDKCQYVEYSYYNDYYIVCNVAENSSTVTLTYNDSFDVLLNLHLFGLSPNKTYVFEFGNNSGNVRIQSNSTTYSNVRINIAKRDNDFDLVLYNISFLNYYTIISSSAHTLNLSLQGSQMSVRCTTGSNGSAGKSYGAFQIGNGENGTNGANGNSPIVCNGVLKIICGTAVSIVGGSGGNGGNGGNSESSGSSGGNGGHGGNGAVAIKANAVYVSFVNNVSKSDLNIRGGNGGTGGTGGWGSAIFGIGKINYGSNGKPGISAVQSNVTIVYN